MTLTTTSGSPKALRRQRVSRRRGSVYDPRDDPYAAYGTAASAASAACASSLLLGNIPCTLGQEGVGVGGEEEEEEEDWESEEERELKLIMESLNQILVTTTGSSSSSPSRAHGRTAVPP